MKKRYCVKRINGNSYLYEWQYIPVHLRNRRNPKRFKWKYIGSQESKKTKRLLRRSEEVRLIITELFKQSKNE